MIKRIIIEGADQQGKTTLCNQLAKQLEWDVIHYRKPDESFNFTSGYKLPIYTISDRNFLSEIVYSKITDRPSRASMELQSNVHRHDETLLIMLDREDDFKFDSNRHEDYNLNQIIKARLVYRDEFKKLNMEKMKLNPNSPHYFEQVQSIINLANGNI